MTRTGFLHPSPHHHPAPPHLFTSPFSRSSSASALSSFTIINFFYTSFVFFLIFPFSFWSSFCLVFLYCWFTSPLSSFLLLSVLAGLAKSTEAAYSVHTEQFCSLHSTTCTAGIACWLEDRTRDGKVASSNPGRSGGRIFFSRVCLLYTSPSPRDILVSRMPSSA